jgi:hypothetical protein
MCLNQINQSSVSRPTSERAPGKQVGTSPLNNDHVHNDHAQVLFRGSRLGFAHTSPEPRTRPVSFNTVHEQAK